MSSREKGMTGRKEEGKKGEGKVTGGSTEWRDRMGDRNTTRTTTTTIPRPTITKIIPTSV